MPKCNKCKKTWVEPPDLYCAECAKWIPEHKLKTLISATVPKAKAVTLACVLQPAKGVSWRSESTLAKNIPKWVPKMVEFLNGNGYWNAGAATTFGDQDTPGGCTEGTCSLDFQGIRAGKGGLFWIDIQAQAGKDKARDTYAQVMIQTKLGKDVSVDTIVEALLASLTTKAGTEQLPIGTRAIIHAEDASDKLP